MAQVFHISEAASIAMHSMTLLACEPDRMRTTHEMAEALHVSEAHLSKVLQRLNKAGLVKAVRGPKGGFILARPGDKIFLLDIFEAMEGPLSETTCLLGKPVCRGEKCILGGLIEDVNHEVRQYLSTTRLADLTGVFES